MQRPLFSRFSALRAIARPEGDRECNLAPSRPMRRRSLTGIALFATLAAPCLQAAVGATELQEAVAEFVEQRRDSILQGYGTNARLEYRVNSLDARLRLADCDVPLAITAKDLTSANRLNVHVSCPGSARWAIYVPVELSIWRSVVVVTAPIARGQTIAESDLGLEEHDVATARGYYGHPSELVGYIARRVLNVRSPVLASQVEAPLQVKRGDKVILTAMLGTLQVKMNGIAEADGRYGDRISVRNSDSQRVIEGRITGPGQVQVAM